MNLLFMTNNGLPRNGLVALYDMGKQIALGNTGQTLVDYTGKGNNAQLGSAVGADTNDPAWNGGLVFGTDDCCLTPTIAVTDTTIIVVAKMSDVSTEQCIIAHLDSTKCSVCVQSNGVRFYRGFDGLSDLFNNTQLTANTPFIAAARSKADYLHLSVNGTDQSITVTGEPVSTQLTQVGRYGASWGAYCAGMTLYMIAVYNRALSDGEYMQAYRYLKSLMNQRGITI